MHFHLFYDQLSHNYLRPACTPKPAQTRLINATLNTEGQQIETRMFPVILSLAHIWFICRYLFLKYLSTDKSMIKKCCIWDEQKLMGQKILTSKKLKKKQSSKNNCQTDKLRFNVYENRLDSTTAEHSLDENRTKQHTVHARRSACRRLHIFCMKMASVLKSWYGHLF